MAKNEPVEFDMDAFRKDIACTLKKHGAVKIYPSYCGEYLLAELNSGDRVYLGEEINTGESDG